MPLCGYWGTAVGGFWWLLPLLALIFMGLMFFICLRGFGCMSGRRRSSGEFSDLRHQVESLKEDVRKLLRQPN